MAIDYPRLSNNGVLIDGVVHSIPGYELLSEIGRGANATVFLGRDGVLGRDVAVKVWNQRGKRRSKFEARKLAQIDDPYFVLPYHYGEAGDHPFIVMEYVQGITLKEWLADERASGEKIAVWLSYASALRKLHSAGILHGDPHVGNVIVTSDDKHGRNIRILDVGTSHYWKSKDEFNAREERLIRETTERLFSGFSINPLVDVSEGDPYCLKIEALNAYWSYLNYADNTDPYAYTMTASAIVGEVLKRPIYNLDILVQDASARGCTTKNRIIKRLNASVAVGIVSDAEAFEDQNITSETRAGYNDLRRKYLEKATADHAIIVPRKNE